VVGHVHDVRKAATAAFTISILPSIVAAKMSIRACVRAEIAMSRRPCAMRRLTPFEITVTPVDRSVDQRGISGQHFSTAGKLK
jgi:hypothetical protein